MRLQDNFNYGELINSKTKTEFTNLKIGKLCFVLITDASQKMH